MVQVRVVSSPAPVLGLRGVLLSELLEGRSVFSVNHPVAIGTEHREIRFAAHRNRFALHSSQLSRGCGFRLLLSPTYLEFGDRHRCGRHGTC